VVGGLIVSQALTLFTVPVTYLYMDQFSEWLSGLAGRRRPREAAVRRDGRQPQPQPVRVRHDDRR
jgi:hypothetical protein